MTEEKEPEDKRVTAYQLYEALGDVKEGAFVVDADDHHELRSYEVVDNEIRLHFGRKPDKKPEPALKRSLFSYGPKCEMCDEGGAERSDVVKHKAHLLCVRCQVRLINAAADDDACTRARIESEAARSAAKRAETHLVPPADFASFRRLHAEALVAERAHYQAVKEVMDRLSDNLRP